MQKRKKLHNLLYLSIILVLSFAAFYFASNSPTGFAVLNATEPSLGIELGSTQYFSGDTVNGSIKIMLTGPTSPTEKLILKIGGASRERDMAALLGLVNRTYELSQSSVFASNPHQSKQLNINANGTATISFNIPKNAELEPITFNFAIKPGSSLLSPRIDVGNDGFLEWLYIGNRTGWGATILPQGASQPTNYPSSGEIQDNVNMFCEIVSFPKATDFFVQAQYQRLNKSGNVRAAILSLEAGSGEGPGSQTISITGMASCDLPEHDMMQWGSCQIALPFSIVGYNIICIYSEISPDETVSLYKIPIETSGSLSQTSYQCSDTSCSLLNAPQKFYLRLQPGVYDNSLNSNKQFNFSRYYTLPSDESGKDYLTQVVEAYLWGCTPDANGMCAVPISFSAESSGIAELSSLELPFTRGALRQTETNFYDLALTPQLIKRVSSIDLSTSNFTFRVPIQKIGNFTASTTIASPTTFVAEANIGEEEDTKTFMVYPSGYISPVTGLAEVESILKETKTALGALNTNPDADQKKVIDLLGLNDAIENGLSTLATYETSLNAAKSGLGDVNVQKLKEDIEDFRSNQVRDIEFETSLTDIIVSEPDDITSDIVPEEEKEETFLLQEKVELEVNTKSYSIKKFDNTAEKGHLVSLMVSPKEVLEDIDIFIVVSKDAVDNVAKLQFDKAPDRIVNPDPIVKWYFSSLAKGVVKEVTFLAKTDKDIRPDAFKAIIARAVKEGAECTSNDDCDEGYLCKGGKCISEEDALSRCGDGVCTETLEDEVICPEDCKPRYPWAAITIIVLVFVLLGIYINLYRGKGNFRELTRGKNPFKNEQDLIAVMEYIKASLPKNVPLKDIRQSLMEKGWAGKQISFAFEELEWVKDLDARIKAVPVKAADMNPMREYVKMAIMEGMKKDGITTNLVSAGWDAGSVRSAYRLAKMRLAWRLFVKKITFSKKTYK